MSQVTNLFTTISFGKSVFYINIDMHLLKPHTESKRGLLHVVIIRIAYKMTDSKK